MTHTLSRRISVDKLGRIKFANGKGQVYAHGRALAGTRSISDLSAGLSGRAVYYR